MRDVNIKGPGTSRVTFRLFERPVGVRTRGGIRMNGLGKRASVPLRTGSDHLLAEVARASSFCPAAIPSGTGAKRVMLWSGNIYPGRQCAPRTASRSLLL